MNDREKVVSEFERCIGSFSPADTSDEYFIRVCKRTLELLKEQKQALKREYMRGYDKAWDEIGRG